MKDFRWIMTFAAVLTLAWGCSSDDEEGDERVATFKSSTIPVWVVDMNSNQEPPQWTAPKPSDYENNLIVLLRLQDELVPYSTADDLAAVFVGDECRALSQRSGDSNAVYFVLNIRGNSGRATERLRLSYYSAGLHQLFSLVGEETFMDEMRIGIDDEFSPPLLYGSTKYPVKTQITVNPESLNSTDFETSELDRVAVFVGDECRGVGTPSTPFVVFGYNKEEVGKVLYYSHQKEGIYTSRQDVALKGETITHSIEF
jgi:hypothetical protein